MKKLFPTDWDNQCRVAALVGGEVPFTKRYACRKAWQLRVRPQKSTAYKEELLWMTSEVPDSLKSSDWSISYNLSGVIWGPPTFEEVLVLRLDKFNQQCLVISSVIIRGEKYIKSWPPKREDQSGSMMA